jgi:hypothetical protein
VPKTSVLLIVFALLTASLLMMIEPASSTADVVENSWVSLAPMHVARANLGVAVVNGKIYAIGGDEGSEIGNVMTGEEISINVVNTTEEYNPTLDAWTLKVPMPTARALFGTAVYKNKVYCIGGYSGADVYVGPHDYDYRSNYRYMGDQSCVAHAQICPSGRRCERQNLRYRRKDDVTAGNCFRE